MLGLLKRDVYAVITDEGMSLRDKAVDIPVKLGACIPLDTEKAIMLYQLLHDMMDRL